VYRVFFDTNTGTVDGRGYRLWFDKSRSDLARIPGGPREGMRVIIYMDEELEMEATLAFDLASKAWIAIPVAGTTKYLPSKV
jgi:hypothetical protein